VREREWRDRERLSLASTLLAAVAAVVAAVAVAVAAASSTQLVGQVDGLRE